MFWLFVKNVERTTKLHFGKFDEGFHSFVGVTIHSVIDSKDFGFNILGFRLFEGLLKNFGEAY